jgi:hypothetical protein
MTEIKLTLQNGEIINGNDIKKLVVDGKDAKVDYNALMNIGKMLDLKPDIDIVLNDGRIINKTEVKNSRAHINFK